jgi:hypothetical protein
MAESTLTLDFTRLRRSIAREIGLSRTSSDWTSDETQDINDILADGLNRFYAAYDWSFLQSTIEIPLYAPYSTGTVAVTSGVVTGTGTTFPSWSDSADLVTDVSREISVYTSGTALTLADTTYTVASGTTYSIVQSGYTLPDNFGHFIGRVLFYRPGDTYRKQMELTHIERIRSLRWAGTTLTDYPYLGAVVPKFTSTTQTAGQRFRLVMWPPPRAASRVVGRYRIQPDVMSSTNVYSYGGMLHGRTIALACLCEAQLFNEHTNGAHEERYQMALEDSIRRDKDTSTPPTLGYEVGSGPVVNDDYWSNGVAPLPGLPTIQTS